MELDGITEFVVRILIFCLILTIVALIILPIDMMFKYPIAADKANAHCKALGFDQHKSFDRIGILSENPVAIKCEYAEKYTDLGVHTN